MNYYNEINKRVKDYSKRLKKEVGKKYNVRYLFDMRKLYLFLKVHPVDAQLTISHYRLLFQLKNTDKINYYIKEASIKNLSKRQLETIIKKQRI